MKQVANEAPRQTVMEAVTAFLTRYRTPIMISLAVIAAAVITLIIVLSVQNSRNEAALTAVEELQQEFDAWLGLGDEEQADGYDGIAEAAAEVIDAYPRTYAASRSRMIDARALSELERWEDAALRYVEVTDLFGDTYLAPVALMDAAVAAENAGDTERSLQLLQRLVDEYEGQSAETPRALFSIGRIHEQRDDVTNAAETYRQLIDSYPASSWTNLARNRIITLTVQGRIGG